MSGRDGFSLLEVAVATLLLGLAAVGILGATRESMTAIQAAREHERAAALAGSKMNELLARGALVPGAALSGSLGDATGWEAALSVVDEFGTDAAGRKLIRIRLEVWWRSGSERKSIDLESYRRSEVR